MPIEKNNRSKEFNLLEPFVRINSREFKPELPLVDGKGRDCGCRNTEDYDSSFLAALIGLGLDELEGLIPVPEEVIDAAKKALKTGADVDVDDFKNKLAKFLANPVEGLIFGSLLRQVPTWVPVNRKITRGADGKKQFDPSFKEKDKEVAGFLSRSFQSYRDLPHLPWQRFYNWHFHVRVDPEGLNGETPDGRPQRGPGGFTHVIGLGHHPNRSEVEGITVGFDVKAFDVAPLSGQATNTTTEFAQRIENSLECVLDTGAFSLSPGNRFDSSSRGPFDQGGDILPGVMFHPRWPFWPTTNDYFWAQGRWVYDCSHVVESSDKIDRHWTQIHPVRAFACFRREGFKFDENDKRVPASRFLFFHTRKGGYHDFAPNKLDPADDPQFIVDLPPAPVGEELEWSIGHTEHFGKNTGVLRPRLLIKTEFAPFGISSSFFQDGMTFTQVDPIIEPIRSKPELTIFDQVKITVPLSKLPTGDKSPPGYGFVVSLGWADPTNELATRVKKVTVTFDSLRNLRSDLSDGAELRFKICVNGHWVYAPLHDVEKENLSLGGSLTLFLPDDATVALSVNGLKRRGYGESMEEENDAKRRLTVGGKLQGTLDSIRKQLEQGQQVVDVFGNEVASGVAKGILKGLELAADLFGEDRPVEWLKDIDQEDDARASIIARSLFTKKFFDTFDDPVGFLDGHFGGSGLNFAFDTGRLLAGQPLPREYQGDKMVDLVKDFADGRKSRTVTLFAHRTKPVGNAHMLSQDSRNNEDGRDYLLMFTIAIDDQP